MSKFPPACEVKSLHLKAQRSVEIEIKSPPEMIEMWFRIDRTGVKIEIAVRENNRIIRR